MSTSRISLQVNGVLHHLEIEDSERMLDVLRDRLGLVGVKEGCGAGECGACSVLLNGQLVNSCLIFAFQLDRAEVLTIEGLGEPEALHPIQQAFLAAAAIQCGFCTPGMVMACKWLLDHNPNPSDAEIREAMSGNLCRCTGYQKIIRAVRLAAENMLAAQNPEGLSTDRG